MLERPTESDQSAAVSSLSTEGARNATEAIRLRNDDHWGGHSVEVFLVTREGEPVHRERRYLPADRSATRSPAIDPGVYRIRIMVDGVERARAESRLDGTPGGTVVVELGNGVVRVTEGPDEPPSGR